MDIGKNPLIVNIRHLNLCGCRLADSIGMLRIRQQTDFYLLLMPGDKPFKTKNLSQQIGSSRLSFATAEHMEKFLNVTPGSVSVLGLMNDTENKVKLLIDADVLKDEFFGCHPLINTSSLKIKTKDLTEKIIPALGNEFQMVEFAAE